MDPVLPLVVIALLVGGKKKPGGSAPSIVKKADAAQAAATKAEAKAADAVKKAAVEKTPAAQAKAETAFKQAVDARAAATKATAAAAKAETKPPRPDSDALVKRANQKQAAAWANDFQQTGVDAPPDLALALARWVGLESSGDPYTPSRLGERGLLQIGKASFADALKAGILTQSDWDKLISRSTPRTEHARLAYRLANWWWDRAKRYVKNPPKDRISAIWYAKLYHQRPVEVRDSGMHGDALPMARELATRWKSDAKKLHRLRAANVVAFGVPNP